jgi:UDP-3-O-[3-hydroxymyristoyl] glucosamine N-acyltransferase
MAADDISLPASDHPAELGQLGDARFFERAGPFDLAHVVAAIGGEARHGDRLGKRLLTGVAPLQKAGPNEVSVLHNPRYAAAMESSRAGLIVVGEDMAARVPPGSVPVVVRDPHDSWAKVATLFHPPPRTVPGVHASAVVDPQAWVDPSAEIGPLAVIGARAEIGAGCHIGAGAVIGVGVVMGEGCRVGALASVSHAIIGRRVYVYPGARIGQEGFGFAVTAAGFRTVPQLGRVILEDDVEIGANSTVDRGASHDTVIGAGSRIDNLIQIGHNVQLGRGCLMAAQSGISGSTVIGDHVQIGAQAGLNGHVTIGSKSRIGAQAGVMSDLAPGSVVVGSPALPLREFFRNVAVLRRLARKGGDKNTMGGS